MHLKFLLAKNALLHFYHYQYLNGEDHRYLKSICEVNDSDKTWKLKLRLLCEENNDVIVSAVLADSTPEEQIFLYDKFSRADSFVKIGLKLNVHPNGLQRWRDKFLSKISMMMDYNLPVEDIFSRHKVEALIFSLERIISFLLSYGCYDAMILGKLQEKLSAYHNLLFAIKQCIESNSEDIGMQVIRYKILNSNKTVEEIARSLNLSHTTVNKYIHCFQKKFYHLN